MVKNVAQNEEYISFLKTQKLMSDPDEIQMALNYAHSRWEHAEESISYDDMYAEWVAFSEETKGFYNSPEHRAGVDLGKSLGEYETFLSVKKAHAMGEIELWLAHHEPKSLEEWEEWEKLHGPDLAARWEK